jgi:hypothetical protein
MTDWDSDALHRSTMPAREVADARGGREERACEIAEIIRSARSAGVGLYDVTDTEIAIIAWSGAGPPTHPRFSRTRALSGA